MIYYGKVNTPPQKKNHTSSLSLVPHANRHVVPPKPSAASTPVDRSEEQQDGNTGRNDNLCEISEEESQVHV